AFPGENLPGPAAEPQLARAAGLPGAERGDAREQRRLRLLAAESAAHAAALDDHVLGAPAEAMRDQSLDLARVLRGAVDDERAVLARQRNRDLALEIEVLLAA